MAKKTSVAELADAELFERLRESKEELFNLRFQHVTGQLDNYARMKQVKKQVARLHTELRAREIAAAEALEAQAQEKVDG
jgi:large subunit ribosomal protein L29